MLILSDFCGFGSSLTCDTQPLASLGRGSSDRWKELSHALRKMYHHSFSFPTQYYRANSRVTGCFLKGITGAQSTPHRERRNVGFWMTSFFFVWQTQQPWMGRKRDSWDGSTFQLERRFKWILRNILQPGMLCLGKKEDRESSRLKLLSDTAPQQGNANSNSIVYFL